jgi:hypothetical protein
MNLNPGVDPFADAERIADDEKRAVTSGDMLRLSGMVAQVETLDQRIADAEQKLNDLKTERWKLVNIQLREMLVSMHVTEHASGGVKVELATEVEAKLPKVPAERQKIMRWLNENKHGGIVKTSVVVELGRGSRDAADRLLAEIQRQTNHPVKLLEDVHHSTYSAFARELVREGVSYPDFLGVRTIDTVHISKTKDRKNAKAPKRHNAREHDDHDE